MGFALAAPRWTKANWLADMPGWLPEMQNGCPRCKKYRCLHAFGQHAKRQAEMQGWQPEMQKKSLPRTGTAKHDLVLPGTITYYYNRHPCMSTLSSFHYSTILQIYYFTISLHIVLP